MSVSRSGNRTHDDTVNAAEGVRQSAVAAAGVSQAAVRTSDIVFYRAALASALANNISPSAFISALRELGTGGA